MTIQNRDRFLDNLAKNLGRPRLTAEVERPKWSLSPQWGVFDGFSQDELIDVLEKQCAVIHTNFKRTNFNGLPETLKSSIRAHDGKKVLVAKDLRNEEFGLDVVFDELQSEGVDLRLWDFTIGTENQVFAEQADIGITFSEITLAESGTITLFNDKNNGRSISLLPRVHVVIIPKSTIVPRMTQAVKTNTRSK